jgi:cell division protein FtsN
MRKSHIVLLALLTAVTFGIAGCSHVAEDWKAAQSADTAEGYQDFLRQHPDSEFGVNAQERIKQLAEDRDWQQAQAADTLDAYQQFVAAHADGKWAQEARVRIENFQLNGSSQAVAPAAAPPAAVAGATPGATSSAAPAAAAPPSKAAAAKSAPVAPAHKAAPPAKPTTAHAAASAAAKPGKHLAQLGAFTSRAGAESAWHKLAGRFPHELKSLEPHYASATSHAKTIVRLQVGLPSAQRARELCAALKKKSQPCVPLG